MDQKRDVQSLFDEVSATYDATGIDFFGQIARTLIGHARLRRGSAVLDIGCGAGAALIAASEAVGARGSVVGIDLAAGMVERSRRVAKQLGLENVRVEVGDAEKPPTEPGSVDAIVASLVLFFLPNIDLALDAFRRALVHGGTLAFSTFAADDDWTPLDRLLAGFAAESPRAQGEAWFESRTGISSVLRAHRFDEISIEEVMHQVDFPTIEDFYEWGWSTGWRATWSAIAAERRAAARASADDYLKSLQERRGCLRFATAVRYTRAETT